MKYLGWLSDAIGAKLNARAIGKPVFLRANLQLSADHGLLLPLAAELVETAGRWLGAPVSTVYAQGGVRWGFISLLLQCESGESALIAIETTHGAQPEAQVLVVGQHGTLRFDDFPEPLQIDSAAPVPTASLVRAIQSSLDGATAVRVNP